jgi:hypothetical protein
LAAGCRGVDGVAVPAGDPRSSLSEPMTAEG